MTPSATFAGTSRPQPTHRQWAQFRAVMLHTHLGRAADSLGTSQPTLSRDLARLEQLLGFALFDRVRGRLRPTVRAMALLEEVERSFIGLDRLAARAGELLAATPNRLRLACLPALAHALLPRALAEFSAQHPGVAVSVHSLEAPYLEQALSEQRFDLGAGETTQAPPGVSLRPLLQANEVAILPRAHPLTAKTTLQATDFAGEPYISLAPGDPYRRAIDAMFEAAQVRRHMLYETESAVAICAMVRQGLGLAIVNPLTAWALAGPDLLVRPLAVAIRFQVNLLEPEVMAPQPLREALAGALQRAAMALVAN